MRYAIGLLPLLCLSFLHARENPFSLALDPLDAGRATHVKEEKAEFNSTKITLPSSARILKSASVTFQNLDGSISEEIIAINQDVNWHYPLILLTDKPKSFEPTLVEMMDAKKAQSQKIEQIKMPKLEKSTQITKNTTLAEGVSVEVIDAKTIHIYSSDKKARDFLVTSPYKVVVDFLKEKSVFSTKTLELSKAPFVSITLGNHDGFYRLAILLDGHYRYDIMPIEKGYAVTLK
jgi:hypothetical protein